MSVRLKIILYFLLVSLLPLFFIITFLLNNTKNKVQDIILDNEEFFISRKIDELETLTDKYKNELLAISKYPPIQGIERTKTEGVDPLDGSTHQQWMSRLKTIFDSFLKSNPEYLQLRYLDEDGKEIVRLDQKNGSVFVTEELNLQNKFDRYYFINTMKLDEGEIFISEFDLNIENGKIEEPHVPVLRFSTPVFNEETNKKIGIVIVNVHTDTLFGALSREFLGSVFVIDQNGQYLFNNDSSKLFGEILGTGENYFIDNPEIKENLIENENFRYFDREAGQLISWKKIHPYNDESYWILISVTNQQEVLAPLSNIQRDSYLSILAVGLLNIGISLLAARSFTKPIIALTEQVKFIAGGNLKTRVKIKTKDEIGFLTDSFNKTLDALSKESGRMTATLESIKEGVVISNDEDKIIYSNPSFLSIASLEESQVLGKVFSSIFKTEAIKGSIKFLLKKSDSTDMVVDVSASTVRSQGKDVGQVHVVHDYSDEFALQKEKDEFFMIASHELRTPLTVISGNIDMLLNSISKEKKNKDINEMLSDSLDASNKMNKIISNFLIVSSLDLGNVQPNIKEVDVCVAIGEAVDSLLGDAEKYKIKLLNKCTSKKISAMADSEILKNILSNLIANGLKFTERGSVEVSIKESSDVVRIHVTDTGIGIEADKQQNLFKRLQQSMKSKLSREKGGTGIGLYICKKYTELIGGKVYLEKSEQGKGSTFVVELKRA